MPILITPRPSNECEFTEWSIRDSERSQLVSALAYLYIQQEENALRVISELEPKKRPPKGRIVDNVIAKLAGPKQIDLDLLHNGTPKEKDQAKNRTRTAIWHRDGLLFQHLSWIVARRAAPQAYMTSPHVRQADKGFDGFIIEFDETHSRLERIILCEDKASEDPRPLITKSVWKEISEIRRGDRDDEILADLTTLLKGVPDLDNEAKEEVVDAIFWENVRQFRVSVATSEDHRSADGFDHILRGFETIAPGPITSRMGGVIAFGNVRQGLENLAKEVAEKVREIAKLEDPSIVR
ncbi:hypothetical protein BV394_12055 [Brevirhabdus pacifica]|uniref:Uncharacterized protein n=1 Tax=Brevirhabdus pacifica TaxID=1267768 RepID=A0A1U7DK70_9RHOB|nr:hypothetical protein [Brevirhabdus pacifica]APX90371.1 hypothetical protein BV394_12055 [Brevirhabdus pacifica]PJJ80827.1 hypothetical protein CLV77_3099 [Brevirhabdus pacifica]